MAKKTKARPAPRKAKRPPTAPRAKVSPPPTPKKVSASDSLRDSLQRLRQRLV